MHHIFLPTDSDSVKVSVSDSQSGRHLVQNEEAFKTIQLEDSDVSELRGPGLRPLVPVHMTIGQDDHPPFLHTTQIVKVS